MEERLYKALRTRAFEKRQSLASVVREALEAHLDYQAQAKGHPSVLDDLVGIGRSKKVAAEPVSLNHDEALAQDIEQEIHKSQERLDPS